MTVEVDRDTLIAMLRIDAKKLAATLKQANEAGIGPAVILPALVSVFREEGMFDGSLADLQALMPGAAS